MQQCGPLILSSNYRLWRLQFILNEIKELSSLVDVDFCYELTLANPLADSLAKQDRMSALVARVM